MKIKSTAMLAVVCLALGSSMATAATLDRIRQTGHIRLGYLPDARPFTFKNDAGAPDGYGVALCKAVVAQVEAQLGLQELTVDWVEVTPATRLSNVQLGTIDLQCAPANITLTHRKELAFSIPVFAGGTRAVIRADAPATLRHLLAGSRPDTPVWRGSPASRLLEEQKYAVVAGTSTETWLAERASTLGIKAQVKSVPDYRTGLQLLTDGKVDVFFGDRSVVLGAMDDNMRDKLAVVQRRFTHDLAGLALERGDDDFRLLVDTALSSLYGSKEFATEYAKWFGPLDEDTTTFFQWTRLGK